MKRKQYITPRIKTVSFNTEEGFGGSVYGSSQNLNEVFISFTEDDNNQGFFRNEQFNNAGDNSNFNFFGD